MIAARWEYENTAISERPLAAKFGISRSALNEWVVKQGWKKTTPLRSYEGDEGQRQFERDVRAAIKRAYDLKIVKALEVTLTMPPAGKPAKPAKSGQNGAQNCPGAWQLAPDPPQSSVSLASVAAEKPSKPGGKNEPAGEVVRFPGAYLPPPTARPEAPTAFPARSKTEQAAMRVHLSGLRGELALQQVEQIKQHTDLLWDYHHLLAVFMNPSKFVDVAGLAPEDAARKLDEISKQAGRLVLPTERDTLSGAILALNKAMIASFAAQRSAVGVTPRQLGVRGEAEDGEPPRDYQAVATADLRDSKDLMARLNGVLQHNNEPPRPPPPEALDDLVVRRDDPPGDRPSA